MELWLPRHRDKIHKFHLMLQVRRNTVLPSNRDNILLRRPVSIRHRRPVSIRHRRLKVSILPSRVSIHRLPMGSPRIGSRIRRNMPSSPMFRKRVGMLWWFQAGQFCGSGLTRG